MAHRRLVIRERITAIVGSSILLGLIGLSYYYSIQTTLSGLRYIPSESSPDFTGRGDRTPRRLEHGTFFRRADAGA